MPRVDAPTLAEHRQRLLARVYAAFETLVDERGYDAVTLAEVARAAGLARTGIYNYFPDKESLLLAYTAFEMDELLSDLRAELSRTDDPLERLDAFVRAHLTYSATHLIRPGPALRSIVSAAGFAAIGDYAAVHTATLQAILEEAAAEASIPPELATDELTAQAVLSCVVSASWHGLRGKRLATAVTGAQAFVRRAVGA